ncbi:Glutamine ABC transporter, periplasmic glutamine-binding protein [Methylocella tundrae]|uniref:Glutamine ABC transporter, periplasmic glutamine-binding protein n=2 Tax=Methylocella tundrae TaxID=227605 RepID=A0A8B6M2V3_METTU|nr:Glutamine ABC transporter, periplasmic glutamine-binding protein [Methylocella tundrae]
MPMGSTISPRLLRIASAFPDPPFEFLQDGQPTGFDIALTGAICTRLGLTLERVPFTGADFNDIFQGLVDGSWDCVASGATVTPERQERADFCDPYVVSGQSLVACVTRDPGIRSTGDLAGRIIGVQKGNTSEPVAERLKSEGRVAEVRIYPYHGIEEMLDDVEVGRIAAAMKLAPVTRWLIRTRPTLRIVQEGITKEQLALSVRRGNGQLRDSLNHMQAQLAAEGALAKLVKEWIEP